MIENDRLKRQIDILDPECLSHHGVKGMKWGVRKKPELVGRKRSSQDLIKNFKQKGIERAYSLGAKINPRETKYGVKRALNKVSNMEARLGELEINNSKETGLLTTDEQSLKALDKIGIERHKQTHYDNLNDNDIKALKKYTDAARYSRGVNGYLAIGDPKEYAQRAKELKETLNKNKVNDQVVYRSLNLKFSTNGISKKLDTMSEKELAEQFGDISKNFKGKSVGENRIYSTSTSPLFAIDTWRKVNPTAAKTYNSYLIIDCKDTPGLYADGRHGKGEKIVNTRSNQEVILAPNNLTYKKMTYDKKRKMFAIHVEAN